MFTKILIANRGEIAIRVIRACKEMGISTVAVYSEADRESLHVALADQAICIGGARAEESYLNGERIVSAALATHAQAIHPATASFRKRGVCRPVQAVRHCVPSAPGRVISHMGDKDTARRLMKENGVPTTPGTDILKDAGEAKKAAEQIGYPVLIKASAGGGGKGIRLVERPEDMERAFQTAPARRKRPLGTAACTWRSTWTRLSTSRCSCWPTKRGTLSAWASGSALSSGTTRSSSRSPPPRR